MYVCMYSYIHASSTGRPFECENFRYFPPLSSFLSFIPRLLHTHPRFVPRLVIEGGPWGQRGSGVLGRYFSQRTGRERGRSPTRGSSPFAISTGCAACGIHGYKCYLPVNWASVCVCGLLFSARLHPLAASHMLVDGARAYRQSAPKPGLFPVSDSGNSFFTGKYWGFPIY